MIALEILKVLSYIIVAEDWLCARWSRLSDALILFRQFACSEAPK